MSSPLPGALLNWLEGRFLKVTSLGLVPNDSGSVEFLVTGTATSKVTYSNATLTTPSTTNGSGYVTLDSEGRPTDGAIYLAPGGYDAVVRDSDGVTLYTIENFEDSAGTFFAGLGTLFTQGAKDVTSGYTVLAADTFITVNSTGGANPCLVNLPAASARVAGTTTSGLPLTIKNVGNIPLSLVPNGSDTIEDSLTSFTVAAAATPDFPTVTIDSDGVSTWWVTSSHAL